MHSTNNHIELKKQIDQLNIAAWENRVSDSDKAILHSKEAVELARQIDYRKGVADALRILGFGMIRKSNFEQASSHLAEAAEIYHSLNDLRGLAVVYEYTGIIQRNKGNAREALENIYKALKLTRETGFKDNEVTNLYQLGVTYRQLADYDKALDYLFESLLNSQSNGFSLMEAYNLNVIGSIYFETGDFEQALNYFRLGLPIRRQAGDKWGEAGSLDNIGRTLLKLKQYDEAIKDCNSSLEITRQTSDKKGQGNTLLHLADIYKQKKDPENARNFALQSLEIRKSNEDRRGEAEVLLFLSQLETTGSEKELGLLQEALDLAIAINSIDLISKIRHHLYIHFKTTGNFKEAISQIELHTELEAELHKDTIAQKVTNLQISNKVEEAQKETEAIRAKNKQIEEQKKELQQTLTELKAAQAQLIQSEKMASLGELTAGIAHEIQNPLNFVNNFSEVNKELIDEANQANESGKTVEIRELLANLKSNQEKIKMHGDRADAIIKSMLLHTRTSTGQKELTDINALCEEYLRLAYHGMRAKNTSFETDWKTDFDPSLSKISVVPQDIGRVLLNLYNNAFQAVSEKTGLNGSDYRPLVSVSTHSSKSQIEITVKDNGMGIPEAIKDKIFQPFFTTKPTGQGTGLGLSLSYDILKAHGGEILVNTNNGEGSEFIIQLPA